jgi:hypothetical protein
LTPDNALPAGWNYFTLGNVLGLRRFEPRTWRGSAQMTRTDLDCHETIRLLDGFLDEELAEEDRLAVEQHLSACVGCQSRARFERRLREKLRELKTLD